jgi:predicted membrane-bound spermidine synthase
VSYKLVVQRAIHCSSPRRRSNIDCSLRNSMISMLENRRRVCFEKSKYIVYSPYPGLHLAYHAKRYLFSGQSKYQKIDIIDNDAYGRSLLLDGNLQHTEYDARIFNEALCSTSERNEVARILVLGGGSGQTAMRLLESAAIAHIALVEIDPLLVESCRKHVKGVGKAFEDPRVRIFIGDAFRFLHSTNERFDAAIIDLTERPLGIRNISVTFRQLYEDINEKCSGRCSQYLGSSIALGQARQFRSLVGILSRELLSNVKYQDVFIPSFGAPHTFMHAGYEK